MVIPAARYSDRRLCGCAWMRYRCGHLYLFSAGLSLRFLWELGTVLGVVRPFAFAFLDNLGLWPRQPEELIETRLTLSRSCPIVRKLEVGLWFQISAVFLGEVC